MLPLELVGVSPGAAASRWKRVGAFLFLVEHSMVVDYESKNSILN